MLFFTVGEEDEKEIHRLIGCCISADGAVGDGRRREDAVNPPPTFAIFSVMVQLVMVGEEVEMQLIRHRYFR